MPYSGVYPGPSPRVWGIHQFDTDCYLLCRSIPTCVGNTWRRRSPNCARPVHPHVCGEYPLAVCISWTRSGPSPRVWGIRLARCRLERCRRSIPTCVGNTRHTLGLGDFLAGPSPRVWGILQSLKSFFMFSRSIPTCVGNTLTFPFIFSPVNVPRKKWTTG